MRTELELFEMYKEEKSLIIGDFKSRTGLEFFPDFKDWKRDYLEDYFKLHVAVSKKEADRLMDEAVDAADEELEAMLKRSMKVKDEPIKKTKTKAVKAPKAKKAKAVSIKSTVKGTGSKRTINKAAITREIFTKEYPRVVSGEISRKDIIAKFIDAGLTAAGSSTYYQRWKKEVA